MKPVVYLNSMGKRLKEIEGTILLNKNELFEVELQNNSGSSYSVDILINDRNALSSYNLDKNDNISLDRYTGNSKKFTFKKEPTSVIINFYEKVSEMMNTTDDTLSFSDSVYGNYSQWISFQKVFKLKLIKD
jgi:hypothetical protein